MVNLTVGDDVNEQLSKVKPISNIVIRDEHDIYNSLTNREKLENLLLEYYNEEQKQQKQQELGEDDESNRQQILLKENRQNIIDFIIDNKDSIKIEDLKISEPVYKCHKEKGNCYICNSLSNIICKNCTSHNYKKEVWLCTNHWKHHAIEKHTKNKQNIKL